MLGGAWSPPITLFLSPFVVRSTNDSNPEVMCVQLGVVYRVED